MRSSRILDWQRSGGWQFGLMIALPASEPQGPHHWAVRIGNIPEISGHLWPSQFAMKIAGTIAPIVEDLDTAGVVEHWECVRTALQSVELPDVLEAEAEIASEYYKLSPSGSYDNHKVHIGSLTSNEAAEASKIDLPNVKATPSRYVMNWGELTSALSRKNTKSERRNLTKLNDLYSGPIRWPGGQGGQPKANLDDLLVWWEGLEKCWDQSDQKANDLRATIEAQHSHGKTGKVLPQISGHVKQTRKKRKMG